MNLQATLGAVRRRIWLQSLLPALPPAAALIVLGASRPLPATALALAALAAAALWARQRARRHDARWLARQLDAHCPALQDSSALLLCEQSVQTPLAALQRKRLQAAVQRLAPPELGPPWPWAASAASLVLSVGLILAVVLLRPPHGLALPAPAGDPRLRVDVRPPAYTAQRPWRSDSLDLRVPAGSRLDWSLRLPAGSAPALVFADGSRLPLRRDGARWTAGMGADASTLYRLEGAAAAAGAGPFRLEVVADAPPHIRVESPKGTLSLREDGQTHWPLAFVVRDDYGLGAAHLALTLAKGGGENIEVREQRIDLGDGQGREARYRRDLDLAGLGFEEGDDLIVRLIVSDRREPRPNEAQSAAYILRWPPPAFGAAEGLEGVVRGTLPAYFRSQRQIILDSEALLAERGALQAARFLDRSDAIGLDQKLLRLRYGQFLGEESATAEAQHDHAGEARGHDDGPEPAPAAFGNEAAVPSQFGHSHDIAEAATLFDPATKRILRAALDEMWQAEQYLRLGEPAQALPYEYRALEYIKQVQQAGRIYLARAGADLPAVDESRRLSGERGELSTPSIALPAREQADSPLPAAWQALSDQRAPPLDALAAWIAQRRDQLPDALALLDTIERLRRQPDCADCRERLRAQLWPLLPTPPAVVQRRREASPP